jgi:G3E family GTPase
VGADLVLVTKTDLVDAQRRSEVVAWLEGVTAAPIQATPLDEIAVEVVLGRPRHATGRSLPAEPDGRHGVEYVAWATRVDPVADDRLREFLQRLPDGVLRAKGEVAVIEPSGAIVGRLVQVVGRTVSVTSTAVPAAGGIEAIGAAGRLDPASLQQLADEYLETR